MIKLERLVHLPQRLFNSDERVRASWQVIALVVLLLTGLHPHPWLLSLKLRLLGVHRQGTDCIVLFPISRLAARHGQTS